MNPFVPWLGEMPHRTVPNGPLSGVRLAVKDVFDVAGLPTGAGHPTWLATHEPAQRDADAVARLTGAGAQIVGKVHTDEFAYSLMGTNAHYGIPENPAAPDRLTGGSSNGSASAVAGGLADLGLGTDTAGSVRVPAAWCGLYGLRPTHSRVSRDGIVPLGPSCDVPGLLSRDLPTLCLGTAALLDGQSHTVGKLRLPPDLWVMADPAVRAALQPTVTRLAGLLPIETTRLFKGDAPDYRTAYAVRTGWEFWQQHGAWITEHTPTFGPGVSRRIDAASRRTSAELSEADSSIASLRTLLPTDAVMIVPTSPIPAPPRVDGGESGTARFRLVGLTLLASLGGLPALNIPAGHAGGSPVGVSLVGPPGTDELLLDLANAIL